MKKSIFLSLALASTLALADHSGHDWSYKNIQSWDGTCKNGQYQSPVDIKETTKALDNKRLKFKYNDQAKDIVNNGHTIQVNFKPDNKFFLQNAEYELVQIHFHSPSEFTINGKHSDLEAHLVHKGKKGEILVISVLFETGEENETVKEIWNLMPAKKGESKPAGKIDVDKLIHDDSKYYRLSGSLTTPPCTEGVTWIILKDKKSVSKEQVKKFVKVIGKNARPTQKLNGREITENQ